MKFMAEPFVMSKLETTQSAMYKRMDRLPWYIHIAKNYMQWIYITYNYMQQCEWIQWHVGKQAFQIKGSDL